MGRQVDIFAIVKQKCRRSTAANEEERFWGGGKKKKSLFCGDGDLLSRNGRPPKCRFINGTFVGFRFFSGPNGQNDSTDGTWSRCPRLRYSSTPSGTRRTTVTSVTPKTRCRRRRTTGRITKRTCDGLCHSFVSSVIDRRRTHTKPPLELGSR